MTTTSLGVGERGAFVTWSVVGGAGFGWPRGPVHLATEAPRDAQELLAFARQPSWRNVGTRLSHGPAWTRTRDLPIMRRPAWLTLTPRLTRAALGPHPRSTAVRRSRRRVQPVAQAKRKPWPLSHCSRCGAKVVRRSHRRKSDSDCVLLLCQADLAICGASPESRVGARTGDRDVLAG